jgi:hypothetical protein
MRKNFLSFELEFMFKIKRKLYYFEIKKKLIQKCMVINTSITLTIFASIDSN